MDKEQTAEMEARASLYSVKRSWFLLATLYYVDYDGTMVYAAFSKSNAENVCRMLQCVFKSGFIFGVLSNDVKN